MKHKYHCRICDEVFFVEQANMNERHSCGAIAFLDWRYHGTDDHHEEHDHH